MWDASARKLWDKLMGRGVDEERTEQRTAWGSLQPRGPYAQSQGDLPRDAQRCPVCQAGAQQLSQTPPEAHLLFRVPAKIFAIYLAGEMLLCPDVQVPGMIPCSRCTPESSGLAMICLSLLSGELCLAVLCYVAVPKSRCHGCALQIASALQVSSGLI